MSYIVAMNWESESDSEQERRRCRSCGEVLAHSAYFRHLHDKDGSICPGKARSCDESSAESDSDNCEGMKLNESFDPDSTFDLRSERDGQCSDCEVDELCPSGSSSPRKACSSTSNSSDSESFSSDGEVWWTSNSESESDGSNEIKANNDCKKSFVWCILFPQHISLVSSTFRKSYGCTYRILKNPFFFSH